MSAAWIIVVVVLWIVVVGLIIFVVGVMRSIATALEAIGAGGVRTATRGGPTAGEPLPPVIVGDAHGDLSALSNVPGPFVLAVLTSHCAPCLKIAEWLRANPQSAEGGEPLVVLTDREGRTVLDLDEYAKVLTDNEAVMFDALRIPGTPFVLAVDSAGKVTSSSLLGSGNQLTQMLHSGTPYRSR